MNRNGGGSNSGIKVEQVAPGHVVVTPEKGAVPPEFTDRTIYESKGRSLVDIREVEPGHVVFSAERAELREAPGYLSWALKDWTRDHPEFQVVGADWKTIQGNTVSFELWYEHRSS